MPKREALRKGLFCGRDFLGRWGVSRSFSSISKDSFFASVCAECLKNFWLDRRGGVDELGEDP